MITSFMLTIAMVGACVGVIVNKPNIILFAIFLLLNEIAWKITERIEKD